MFLPNGRCLVPCLSGVVPDGPIPRLRVQKVKHLSAVEEVVRIDDVVEELED